MHPRLASDLWVSAYLARLRLADIPAYVTAKGDPTSGAVVVKCATLDGAARAYQRSYDLMADERTGSCWPRARRRRSMPPSPAPGPLTATSGSSSWKIARAEPFCRKTAFAIDACLPPWGGRRIVRAWIGRMKAR